MANAVSLGRRLALDDRLPVAAAISLPTGLVAFGRAAAAWTGRDGAVVARRAQLAR